MRSLIYAVAVVALASALATAQTTSQPDSPAPNSTAGTYSGNTPRNTPQNDGVISSVPNPAATTSHPANTPREHNWGWIGIFGLAGLAGLRNRNRSREVVGSTRPRAAA